MSGTPTAYAISPDSGRHWTDHGAWPVAEGIHRIPLPLPSDALRAINVYAVEVADGLVLVDGGWAITEAREVLDAGLRSIGSGFGDIRRFLVTHAHRDHYTLARVLGDETGAEVVLGRGEEPSLSIFTEPDGFAVNPFAVQLRRAGAAGVAEIWDRQAYDDLDVTHWARPDVWLDGDVSLDLGPRVLDAVATPGHTPGHYVFADRVAGLLMAGDHVLPTITPSIGFIAPLPPDPLGDFMASLTKVRGLPDLEVLPAHGPVGASSHARVDELLAHHEERLAQCLAAVAAGSPTPYDVAGQLGWTRHATAFADLDVFNQGLATMETQAHLAVLVARGQLTHLGGDASVGGAGDETLRYALPN